MRYSKIILLLLIELIITSCLRSRNNFIDGNKTQILIQGTWTSVEDTLYKISINKVNWIDIYEKDTLGVSKCTYSDNGDSIKVYLDSIILMYQISYIDESNMTLNYLGLSPRPLGPSKSLTFFKE